MFNYINFQSIGVTDQDRALAFYRDILGFTVHTDAPYQDDMRWIFMELPGGQTKIQFEKRNDTSKPQKPNLVLVTDDVDTTCKTLKSRGVDIVSGPDNAPWDPTTRWAMIYDSENNLILIQTV